MRSRSARGAVYDESQMDGLDINRPGTLKKLLKGVGSLLHVIIFGFRIQHSVIACLKMKNIKSVSAFVLLQLAVLPCFARSARRSNSPTLENSPSLSGFSSLNSSLCVLSSPLLTV